MWRTAERGFGVPAVVLLALLTLMLPVGATLAATADPGAVRLIMVHDPSCHYCARWEAEVGVGYSKSSEGRFAPLERVLRNDPQIKDFAPITFTPTFIVVRGAREVGRIAGYPGRDYFYPELSAILEALGYPRE